MYCIALGLLAYRSSVSALEAELSAGPTPGTYRGYAALALAVMPNPASRTAIWKRLPDEADPRVRGDFAIALGLLGDDRVRGYLLDELHGNGGNFSKCTAAAALGVLRRVDAVDELVHVLENDRVDGIVRALCAVALGQIADPSLVPKLSRLSSGGDSTLATKMLQEALTIL
jgi:HEAT repeat protein